MSEDHGVESEGAGEAARAAAGTTSQEQSLPPQQEQPLQKEQQQEQEQEEQQQEESARSMLNAKRGAKISFPKPTSQRMSDSMWKVTCIHVKEVEVWSSILEIPWQPMSSSTYLQVRV
jgi:hypothetical protein